MQEAAGAQKTANSAPSPAGITRGSRNILRSPEDLLHEAKQAEAYGAERFGIVTSGRGQSDPVQFASIVKAVRLITKETKLSVCCSWDSSPMTSCSS